MPPKTLYQILEIPTDANDREIKRAYHSLAKRLHPDKASGEGEAKRLEEEMAAVSQAYNILKDPKRRADYDAQLKGAKAQAATMPPSAKAPAPLSPKAKGATDSKEAGGAAAVARRTQIGQKALARGIQLLNADDPVRALEFLEAAVANNGEDAQAHARLAEALLLAGKSLTRATKHAERAIDLDPWNVRHRLTLAKIFERAGVKSRALEAYREVLKWDAHSAVAQAKISELTRGKGVASSVPFAGLLNRLFRRKG
ncbi:J domain-containing protein [Candidatus Sumerlaeota bacterium]|nr:J domain-containing protein [Candidatus Sumerlaeota bacterium]